MPNPAFQLVAWTPQYLVRRRHQAVLSMLLSKPAAPPAKTTRAAPRR